MSCVASHVLCSVTQMSRLSLVSYASFAAYGSFWGTWGSGIPRLQEAAGLSDSQLGLALLFVGAGALPFMLGTGRALDRWGAGVAAAALVATGVSGIAASTLATNLGSACLLFAVVGAASGAGDVAINGVAGAAEARTGAPVVARAHGVFSSFVVVGSIATGAVTGGGLPVVVPFVAVTLLTGIAAVLLIRTRLAEGEDATADSVSAPRGLLGALLLIGVLGALAFASENAHQSWGAVFLERELATGAGLSSAAPAVFAALVAAARFSLGAVPVRFGGAVLVLGSTLAAAGAAVLAISTSVAVALVGLGIAAVGTAVLYPTLVGMVSRRVDRARRGTAISLLATVSYLGFLLGPVYVGALADLLDLRMAMLGVAALGVVLALLAPIVMTRSSLLRDRVPA